MSRKVKPYVMENCAEDGTTCTRFATFDEANEALEELTGTTFQAYADYLGRPTTRLTDIAVVVEGGHTVSVTDDWGRRVSIYKN